MSKNCKKKSVTMSKAAREVAIANTRQRKIWRMIRAAKAQPNNDELRDRIEEVCA